MQWNNTGGGDADIDDPFNPVSEKFSRHGSFFRHGQIGGPRRDAGEVDAIEEAVDEVIEESAGEAGDDDSVDLTADPAFDEGDTEGDDE